MKRYLELTIPVLNEEKRLENGIRRTVAFLRDHDINDWCLIIADNGSTDSTEELGLKLSNEFPGEVEYLKVPRRGVGLALQTSWMKSTASIVGYMDIDLATDITHLSEVLSLFLHPETKVVVGSRLKKGAIVENRTLLREFTSRIFNAILACCLGVKFSDGMCGFKFFKRDIVVNIIRSDTTMDGWFFCTEILIKIEWKKIMISEIPVHWTDDTDSRVKIIKVSTGYLREIMRLMRQKKKWLRQYVS